MSCLAVWLRRPTPSPTPTASNLMLRAVVQIAERNKLMHLLPYKTLEEVQAAYNFGCLQVNAQQWNPLTHGITSSCPPCHGLPCSLPCHGPWRESAC